MPALLQHFLLTLRLNLRSKQALVYGYLVPVFFLLAFGSVFRSGIPPLLREMGQLLTISTLGGACFGMPTAMVAERERGVWRRYRLLPAALGSLITSTLLARFLIVASAALMQIALARLIYGTPLPMHPLQLLIAFTFVAFSFLAMGLVITALAGNVPAVQALGQAIFLPMIMVGGVGVPLRILPGWAQTVAGFLPGRYAVQSLQACFTEAGGLHNCGFDLLALAVIGVAACIAGLKLFRWDSNQHISPAAKAWVGLALLSWIAVGFIARSTGRLQTPATPTTVLVPIASSAEPYESITDAQIAGISYDNLPPDDGTVTPLSPTVQNLEEDDKQRLAEFSQKLDNWLPAHVESVEQRARNLLCAAAIADVTEDPLEGQIARTIFERMKDDFTHDQLVRVLAWIILNPEQGPVICQAPELGLDGKVAPEIARQRVVMYAQKFLGRLTGKIAAGS